MKGRRSFVLKPDEQAMLELYRDRRDSLDDGYASIGMWLTVLAGKPVDQQGTDLMVAHGRRLSCGAQFAPAVTGALAQHVGQEAGRVLQEAQAAIVDREQLTALEALSDQPAALGAANDEEAH